MGVLLFLVYSHVRGALPLWRHVQQLIESCTQLKYASRRTLKIKTQQSQLKDYIGIGRLAFERWYLSSKVTYQFSLQVNAIVQCHYCCIIACAYTRLTSQHVITQCIQHYAVIRIKLTDFIVKRPDGSFSFREKTVSSV